MRRTKLAYHNVNLKASRLRIALLQLTGPRPDGKKVMTVEGRPTLRWNQEQIAGRIVQVSALIKALALSQPRPDIVVCPEYTIPLTKENIQQLQEIANETSMMIIPGADNESLCDKHRKQNVNEAVVIIPGGDAVFVEKRKLSVWEQEKQIVNEPTSSDLHIFTWKVGKNSYWFTVQVCIDFLFFAEKPPQSLLTLPGVVITPMCSPDMDDFRVHANALRRRSRKGIATVLCNCIGGPMRGESEVILTTVESPEERAGFAPVSLSSGLEECVTVEVDLDHLILPVGKTKDTKVALGATRYYEINGSELVACNDVHPRGWAILSQLNKALIQRFSREEWPYDLDKDQFVQSVEFKVGDIKHRDEPHRGMNCLTFLRREIQRNPLIVVGYYGMGKTTLTKMLFASIHKDSSDLIPVFLSLRNRRLRDLEINQLGETLARAIASQRQAHSNRRQLDNIRHGIDKLIDAGQLVVLFDGIDESVISNRDELVTFLKQLHESQLRYVLTARLEFFPFFDASRQVFTSNSPKVVELLEWGPAQWEKYVKALSKELAERRELVKKFYARLQSRHYASLPARPLFLRMLADLEVRNNTGISIDDRLSDNLSEVYFKFISWKIKDDYDRKGGANRFDAGTFQHEAFNLLSRLAALEYDRGRTSQVGDFTVKDVSSILASREFETLKNQASDALLQSSLFSILRRSNVDTFQFSHKSFMEYLVAHLYAATIFASPGVPSKSECAGIWGLYQTYEVSQHFISEVERIRVSNNLTNAMVLEHFREAFVAALDDNVSMDYNVLDQRIQSVLYYAGRLRLRDRRIQSELHSILEDPENHHKIYRRSASISLGILESSKYADDYALSLIVAKSDKDSDYFLNLSVSKDYYGIPGIELVLKDDLEKFLSGGNPSPILSLKLVSYCAYMEEASPDSQPSLRRLVLRTRTEANRRRNAGLERVCDAILESWSQTVH